MAGKGEHTKEEPLLQGGSNGGQAAGEEREGEGIIYFEASQWQSLEFTVATSTESHTELASHFVKDSPDADVSEALHFANRLPQPHHLHQNGRLTLSLPLWGSR